MPENKIEPFEFKQCVSILKSTGEKARNLRELREIISRLSDESIFHHTYQYFLKGHILEYTNDFSHWAGESLEERALAEHLSSIDPYTFKSINDVRKELIRVIDNYLNNFPEPRDVISGDEFYFNETVTLVFPVGVKVKNLAEFLVALEHIDAGCIYFHFYESRVRLGEGIDDFSRWIEHTLGRKELAEKIRTIDPFMHSIEKIREHITEVVEEYVRADMEGVEV
jgi:septum formation topological specificity factor MinE